MNTTPPTEPPAGSSDTAATTHELSRRGRGIATVLWSGFLAAALATMLCFAFVDPQALGAGEPPAWWSSRLHVYAIGFFFFWLVGLVAAVICWNLARDG